MSYPNIHDEYFLWLLTKVNPPRLGYTYSKLASYMHNRWEFYWSVDYDENRQADGFDLRDRYLDHIGTGIFSSKQIGDLMMQPVSVFEVLVALCERMDFMLDDLESKPRTHIWFRELMDNLDLAEVTDAFVSRHGDEFPQQRVDRIVQVLLDRTYDEDGSGSLFPVRHKRGRDMRELELWYQMSAYLIEKHPM